VKDVKANVEDEKEHMTPDNYEDTIDVLGMISGNLQKVSEHGQNTTRTLKAMEEMLKDRSGGMVKTDLLSVLYQNREMVNTYYQKVIQECKINVTFDIPDTPLYVNANPELLSNTIMSMLGNSIYYVARKTKQMSFSPTVSLKVTNNGDLITMRFYDNGLGIEDTIIDKIFDPFFTTKTTGEASGIGLYLSHDVIQNYGGDITVRSEKNEFTEFIVTLPAFKE
jgi:signal transduction histidine kinase